MSIKKLVEWSPRILSILLILLLLMFSFDIFDSGDVWYEVLLGFLIHNIPVFILIIVLVVAWTKPLVGSLVYTSVAILYICWMLFSQGISQWVAMITLGLPGLIIGILYYIDYKFV